MGLASHIGMGLVTVPKPWVLGVGWMRHNQWMGIFTGVENLGQSYF